MKFSTPLFLCILIATGAALSAQKKTVTCAPYGSGCGPVLSCKVTPNGGTHRVAMTVSKAAPGSLLYFFVGAQRADVKLAPIFGGNLDCRLLTVPVFAQVHRANAQGRYIYARALSATLDLVAHVQFAEVRMKKSGSAEVLSTNGMTLTSK